jgi:adenylate cyclase
MTRVRWHISKNLHYLIPLLILIVASLVWVKEPDFFVEFRLRVFDDYLRLKPRIYQPVPVRIVDIDDDSLEWFGQWPWPRTLLAKLVSRLNELGAAAVVFDILFLDPDRSTPSRLIDSLDEIAPGDPVIARFKQMPDHDLVFADAIKQSNVVLGFAPKSRARNQFPYVKASFSTVGDDPRPWVPHFVGAASDLQPLQASAAGSAMLDTFPERDGISRRVPLLTMVGPNLYPALALDALRVAQGARGYVARRAYRS